MSTALQKELAPEVPDEVAPDDIVRVLLIDDDPAYRQLCQRYLAKDTPPKYEVVAVSNASAGLDECHAQKFDCLLIDYSLPDVSGTQIIRTLRSTLSETTPPTIILTAGGGEAAATEALRAGATDFLPKRVVSAESLSSAINNAVEKGRLRDSVEIRSQELQRANKQLQLKNEEIQRFYHSVSHEVKTPLAATREFIAIALDGIAGPVTDKQKEILAHALDSCDQISAHFDDLIDMTRLETGKITLNKRLGSLDAVVIRCHAAVAAEVNAKKIHVKQEIESSIPLLSFDCNRVIQVLSNFMVNAIKFSKPDSTITLSIRHNVSTGYVEIAVSDTGCGIDPEDLPRIFERLYQVHGGGDESMGVGLGLGLTIAKEIVALHGGDIWTESIV